MGIRFPNLIKIINPRIALWSKKKAPRSVFESVKNSVQRWALPFRDFSWIWSMYKMQRSDRQLVHRKLFVMASNTCDFFQTGEILWPYCLIWQNRSRISIAVIQVTKSNFPTTATSKEVSPNDCDYYDRYCRYSNGNTGVFGYEEFKESAPIWLRQRPTTGNCNMAAQTRNTLFELHMELW